MIQTKEDLRFYLEEDRKALSIPHLSLMGRIKEFFFPYEIWRFQKYLRKLEYYTNASICKPIKWGG